MTMRFPGSPKPWEGGLAKAGEKLSLFLFDSYNEPLSVVIRNHPPATDVVAKGYSLGWQPISQLRSGRIIRAPDGAICQSEKASLDLLDCNQAEWLWRSGWP